MDKATKWGLIIAILGLLVALLALFRDVYDFQISPTHAIYEPQENFSPKEKITPPDDSVQNTREGREDAKPDHPMPEAEKSSRIIFKRDNSFSGKWSDVVITIKELREINEVDIIGDQVGQLSLEVNETKSIIVLPGSYRLDAVRYVEEAGIDINVKAKETVVVSIVNFSSGFLRLKASAKED